MLLLCTEVEMKSAEEEYQSVQQAEPVSVQELSEAEVVILKSVQ